MNTVTQPTRIWIGPGRLADRRGRSAAWMAAFVLATALAAQVAVPVPFSPVPMTLQSLAVLLTGVLLGPWLGATTMVAYVALGAAGAPVFSMGGAGLPWLLGPTGGYLLAMPLAAFLAGHIAGADRPPLRVLAALLAGTAVIYLGGMAQLLMLGAGALSAVFAAGVAPFLVGDAIKVALALVLTGAVRRTDLGTTL